LWAIQAKAYDDIYSIKKADVDTFLSESSREVFSFRLLIATTNLVGQTAERTLRDQEKPVGQILFSDIEKSEVIWPLSPDKLEAEFQEQKKPRPHQEKAISDLCKGFSEHNRGQLIMACGTGKTLVSLWAAERLQSQRTLILLPSLSLLAQILREWTANTSQDFHYLPVCSDDTVRDADHFISRTGELGFPVTTSPDEVAEFLRKQGHIVVFSTYQSSPVIAEAFTRDNVQSFDLVIADEAHRCAGIGTGPFATILDSNAIKTKKLLFMTATPRYFTDRLRKEAEEVDYEIASMDDESKFGPAFHQLTFSEAIKQDLLTDYQVVIIAVDNATYQEYAEKETFVTFDGQTVTDARTLASQIALAKGMRKYNLQRIISFHGRIKRAKEFSKQLPEVVRWMPEESRPTGKIWSEHVSGEMSSGRRDVLLNRFRHLGDGERGLLTNARCLGEGVDLPTLDGVAFIDPRHSQLDIVQAVGRAMRKAPDKKIGTVVLPVFIDTKQDSKTALESSAFRPIWDVLKALRAHDGVLAEALDLLRRQLGHYGNKEFALPQKFLIDLPITVGKSFAESFRVKIVERSTSSWEFWFGLLQNYVETNGDALVSLDYKTDDGVGLGAWVGAQRQKYRKRQLSLEKQKTLEQLPGWSWDPFHDQWQEGLRQLNQYVKNKGNALVPAKYKTKEGFALGRWVRRRRWDYSQGKLSTNKQKVLEQLSSWKWDVISDMWQEGFEHLQDYVDRKGSGFVPTDYIANDGYNLGNWVGKQRGDYLKGKLSLEEQQALEELPEWTWDTNEAVWLECLTSLQEYAKQYGNTSVPRNYFTKHGYNLGIWVTSRRRDFKLGKLTVEKQKLFERIPCWVWTSVRSRRRDFKLGKLTIERQKLLERIPGRVWDTLKAEWQEGFMLLFEYVEREGKTILPNNYVTEDGYKLRAWVTRQRGEYRKGKLSPDKQKVFEQIPGWTWDPRESAWQEGLAHLRDYVEHKGNARVPAKYKTKSGFSLGQWVHKNRQAHQERKLSEERQKSLEQFLGWSWGPHNKAWQEGLGHLRTYLERNGHARVPTGHVTKSGYNLGGWVKRWRCLYEQGKLPTEQKQALEQLAGWTWDINKSAWDEGLTHLRDYVKRNGDAAVPQRHITEDDFTLGSWVARQRRVYQQGKLPTEQKQSLEQLAGWTWNRTKSAWIEGFTRLHEYVKQKGDAAVPGTHITEDGYKLGLWVSHKRQQYKQGKLTAERQKILEQLPGWTWGENKKRVITWSDALKYLQEYVKREGHASVPAKYATEDGYNLGIWVSNQRKYYKQEKIISREAKDT
jgi:superfamily II DNA or RNA helicase